METKVEFYVAAKREGARGYEETPKFGAFQSLVDALSFAQEKADFYDKEFLVFQRKARPARLTVYETLFPKEKAK